MGFGEAELVEFPYEILDFDWLEELVFGFYHNFEEVGFCHLRVGMCYLKVLSEDLGRLKNLKLLPLSGSPFGGIKPDLENFEPVFELKNLEFLYLDGTKITIIV